MQNRIRAPFKITFLMCLLLPVCSATEVSSSSLSLALRQLYNSRFDQSRQTLRDYSGQHPNDPLAYSLKAATYLFAELDRSGSLQSDLLSDGGEKQPAMDPASRAALDQAVQQARQYASDALKANPGDQNSLLAIVIASGVQRDYLALVEHRYRESYDYIKESQSYASRLLKIDPCAYDAYFTKGFTEYLIGSMPLMLRWFMKIDDLVCTRQQGLQDLQLAADQGQYMKPFARIMLAMFYLREKKSEKTEQLLAELTRDFPDNQTFRIELLKLRSQGPKVSRSAHLLN